jgi:alanine racemase
MQRQAALICALAAMPDYLLLDEVFDGLDPVMRQLLKRIISDQVSQRNVTVVIASHNLRELEDFCDHVGLLHEGGVVFEQELDELIAALEGNRSLRVATIFAHLSCADDPSQDDFTRQQIALFDKMSRRIAESMPYDVLRHTANSAAIERFPEAAFDMCRLGLGLYGYGYHHNEELKPVATLKTRIVQLRHRAQGEAIGYGRSQRLERDSIIATIPVGYADGLDRHLSGGRWSMLVAGHTAPTVGRICMDSCMIDVTDIEGVKEGDEVTIFSAAKGNTLEDMADVLGTISYEIMTSVSARVKRIYVRE